MLLPLLFFLLLPLAAAESLIEVTPVKNTVSVSDQARFAVKITNTADKVQRYSLYSLQSGQGWSVDPSPLRDRIIELPPGGKYTTHVVVDPLDDFPPSIYKVSLTIETDLGERHTEELKVYLLPDKPVNYLPSISVEVDVDEKIDPREPVSLKFFLENKNPLNLSNLKFRVQSEMAEFMQEVDLHLPPLQKKTVELGVIPNPFQQPKEYTLFFIFEREGETVKVLEKKVEILPLELPFTVEETRSKKFLNTLVTVSVHNPGNVLNTQEVKSPLSLWAALFTRSADGEVLVDEGQRSLQWELILEPNESVQRNYVIHYRVLFYLALLLLVFLLFYLWIRSSISLKKTAVATKSGEDGTLSELKVTIELRNNFSQPLKDVFVTDTVPAIANVEKSLELGTLKPEEIKHTPKGTKVIWHLAEVEGHEHRLITYKVRAKLNILGTLSLPRAVAEYKKRKSQRKSYSNIYRLES